MDLTLNSYGAWEVTLSDGSALILREARDGGLEVAARDGRLVVRPNVSNEVVLRVEGHFQDSRKLAARDRIQEFLRQRDGVRGLDPEEVVGINTDPGGKTAALLVEDLKLLAGGS